MGENWISVPTAARALGLPLSTVYRMVQRGDLPGEVVPAVGPLGDVRRRYRVRRSEVDRFVEQHRRRP